MKIPRWLSWVLPRPPLTELLTPRAQQAIALSRRVVHENQGSASVDTEHLLAGILRLNHGGIIRVLQTARVDVSELRASLDRPGATPTSPAEAMQVPFLPSIKRALSAAMREARNMGDAHVGTEHLLLGILAGGKGPGAGALVARGLTFERAREIVRAMREAETNGQSSAVLIMFDVDGTLTESFDLDSATYLDALREVFGFHDVSDDWAVYRHVTDAGILAEVFETRRGRPPTPDETDAMRGRFAELLAARVETAGGIRPVPGAAELLSRLHGSPERYAVAYASGGWKTTAQFKLRSAGLPVDDVPGAFSDDGASREEICRAAQRRTEAGWGRAVAAVVSGGVGVCAGRPPRRLGYGFIGIGRGAGAAKLRSEGAVEVLGDFQDVEAFLAAVERAAATLPASSRSGGTAESAR